MPRNTPSMVFENPKFWKSDSKKALFILKFLIEPQNVKICLKKSQVKFLVNLKKNHPLFVPTYLKHSQNLSSNYFENFLENCSSKILDLPQENLKIFTWVISASLQKSIEKHKK
jgi:hypothetical protein